MSKNKPTSSGIVYSTNPDFKHANETISTTEIVSPAQQTLKLRLDTKHRGGKLVTLVEGFKGPDAERELLGKKLKAFCGTGGSVKEEEIIIQGDNRDKAFQWLIKNGYQQTKKL